LQPSTSINRGLTAVLKVECLFLLNPHSLISTDLRVRGPAGTHPPSAPKSILTHFTTITTTAFKAPAVTF
jgi:hypothetical protein